MNMRRNLLYCFFFLSCVYLPLPGQSTNGTPLPARLSSDLDSGRFSQYRAHNAPHIRASDSERIDTLTRAGNLYLSLRDAILLAIENNLDIEYQRVTPFLAEADLLRARGGGIIRGVPSNIREGPSGTGGAAPGQSISTQGISGTSGSGTGAQQDQLLGLTSGTSVPAAGPSSTVSGPTVPTLDPAIIGSFGWSNTNRPQTNTFITGTNASTARSILGDVRIQQGFLFGGTASLGLDATRQNTNNLRADINPATSGGLELTYVQPLLQGFGFAVNNRYIRIAKNNRQISDLVFQQQVISTSFGVTQLYWDLSSLLGQVSVQRQTLDLSQRLLAENQQREEAGTVAPIDVVRAKAEVARARRDLTVAETNARQQETILKDYLTRGMVDSSRLNSLHIVLTDSITPPAQEPVQPLQDLVQTAQKQRPELAQSELQTHNAKITMTGSRSALLPSLNLVLDARSNSLAGPVSTLPTTATGSGGANVVRSPDPSFIGGIGTGFGQIFAARFPDYTAEVQLNIPIFNRIARADYARDQLTVRQQEIRTRQLQKQLRVEIVNALIAVEQSRAALASAKEAREFQASSLDAERERYAVGASTNYLVIQYQRDLGVAEQTEVAALADYAKAKASLQRATGTLLDDLGITLEGAFQAQLPASDVPVPRP